MADTAIVGRNVEVIQASAPTESGFSWGAAFAGALAASAVSFLLISLGAGVGLLAANPYAGSPSLTTLTIGGAIWIVLAQTWGFAVGGYLAGRLRSRATLGPSHETDFRDGAHGFVAWAVGVVLTATMVAFGSMFAAGLTGHVGASLGAGAAAGTGAAAGGALNQPDPTAYFVDSLFRTAPGASAGSPAGAPATTGPAASQSAASPQGEQPPNMQAQGGGASGNQSMAQVRTEVTPILTTGLANGHLSDEDRAYLARLVAARTGLDPAEATRRVEQVEQRAREYARAAADKARKAGAMLSFWTFMALLMGGAAAVLGGILGGNHRDEDWERGLRAR